MFSLCAAGMACGGDDDKEDSGSGQETNTNTPGDGDNTPGDGDNTGEDGSDDCIAETDAALCAGKTCGSYSVTDSCGVWRTVACGTCEAGYSCGGDYQCVADETSGDSDLCAEDLSAYDSASISGSAEVYDYSSEGYGSWADFFNDDATLYIGLLWDESPATFENRTIDAWDDSESDGYYSYTAIDSDGFVECYSYNCVLIVTEETYFEVYSGKLTVSSISGTFGGSVSDADFIDILNMEYSVDADGYMDELTNYCLTPKISFSFSGSIVE